MNTLFPFGLPFATALYLTLYILTLVIHFLLMSYLLAGTVYLVATYLFPGARKPPRYQRPLAMLLRDWMPFALGAAITAGVAPLLFIQILYKQPFYTANLLLSHRWMAILPILIVGYYCLYLLKTEWVNEGNRWRGTSVSIIALVCFAFTGYSWTENHLLGLNPKVWPDFYVSHAFFYASLEAFPRVALWFFGTWPVMILLAAWQFCGLQTNRKILDPREKRLMGNIALTGLVLAALAALFYYFFLLWGPDAPRLTGRLTGLYLLAAIAGVILQAIIWRIERRMRTFAVQRLAFATGGAVLMLLGACVVREAIRIGRLGIENFAIAHALAAAKAGFPAFAFFLVINVFLIGWCVVIVKRNLTQAS